MKYHILFNPAAASGSGEKKARRLDTLLEGELLYYNMHEVEDYGKLFGTILPEDTLIVCGGDGTLNRFINDTEGLALPKSILFYSCGTGNDFLRDIEKPAGCAPFSLSEYLNDLPTVTVKGKSYRFINGVGFGIDGYCCEVGDKLRAASDKPVNYTAIAIKGLLGGFKPTNAKITVDGTSFEYRRVWIAPTMKGRFYGGGMMSAPAQSRKDPEGKCTVTVMHKTGKLRTLMIFPSIFKGEHVKHTKSVATHTGREITVEFDRPTALQIDGETVLGVTSYSVKA